MNKIILIIFLLLMFTNSLFALEYDKAQEYTNKIVVVTYHDYGETITAIGKVITIFLDKDDYTIDNVNALMIVLDHKRNVHNIRINKIINIQLLEKNL